MMDRHSVAPRTVVSGESFVRTLSTPELADCLRDNLRRGRLPLSRAGRKGEIRMSLIMATELARRTGRLHV